MKRILRFLLGSALCGAIALGADYPAVKRHIITTNDVPSGNVNDVLTIGGSGTPTWAPIGAGSAGFGSLLSGTNTSATMGVGSGATLKYDGTGVVNANQFKGITSVDATEFGYLDGVTSPIQTQLNNKQPLSSTLTALSTNTIVGTGRIPLESQITAANFFICNTVSELATIAGSGSKTNAYVNGYWSANDGGGGWFYWTSTGTANGGTCFAGSSGYWNRYTDSGTFLNVRWFGATREAWSDDSSYIQQAINVASNTIPCKLFFPPGKYRVDSPIFVSHVKPQITHAGDIHMELLGAGDQSTYIYATNTSMQSLPAFFVFGNQIDIKNMTFVGAHGSSGSYWQRANGIVRYEASRYTEENLTFRLCQIGQVTACLGNGWANLWNIRGSITLIPLDDIQAQAHKIYGYKAEGGPDIGFRHHGDFLDFSGDIQGCTEVALDLSGDRMRFSPMYMELNSHDAYLGFSRTNDVSSITVLSDQRSVVLELPKPYNYPLGATVTISGCTSLPDLNGARTIRAGSLVHAVGVPPGIVSGSVSNVLNCSGATIDGVPLWSGFLTSDRSTASLIPKPSTNIFGTWNSGTSAYTVTLAGFSGIYASMNGTWEISTAYNGTRFARYIVVRLDTDVTPGTYSATGTKIFYDNSGWIVTQSDFGVISTSGGSPYPKIVFDRARDVKMKVNGGGQSVAFTANSANLDVVTTKTEWNDGTPYWPQDSPTYLWPKNLFPDPQFSYGTNIWSQGAVVGGTYAQMFYTNTIYRSSPSSLVLWPYTNWYNTYIYIPFHSSLTSKLVNKTIYVGGWFYIPDTDYWGGLDYLNFFIRDQSGNNVASIISQSTIIKGPRADRNRWVWMGGSGTVPSGTTTLYLACYWQGLWVYGDLVSGSDIITLSQAYPPANTVGRHIQVATSTPYNATITEVIDSTHIRVDVVSSVTQQVQIYFLPLYEDAMYLDDFGIWTENFNVPRYRTFQQLIDSQANPMRFTSGTNISFVTNFDQISVNLGSVAYTWPSANASGFLKNNGSGTLSWVSVSGSSPGGSDKQIQYNSSGTFAGATGLTYDSSSSTTYGYLSQWTNGVKFGTSCDWMFPFSGTSWSVSDSAGGNLSFYAYPQSSGGYMRAFVGNAISGPTSGIHANIYARMSFSPTSGTASYSGIDVNDAINQTGGANGVTRGIYVRPTLTSAYDYRGIEVANGAGAGLVQSGSGATNYFAGLVTVANNVVASMGSGVLTYVDMNKASSYDSVTANVTFLHATNGAANIHKSHVHWLANASGSDKTLTIPSQWKTNIYSPVPTALTNGTITKMYVDSFGSTGNATEQANVAVSFEYFK